MEQFIEQMKKKRRVEVGLSNHPKTEGTKEKTFESVFPSFERVRFKKSN